VALLVGELRSVLDLDTTGFDKGLSSSESKFKQHSRVMGAQSKEISKQAGAGMAGAERSSFRLQGTLGKLGGVAGRASVGLGGIAKSAGIVGVAVAGIGGAVVGAGIKLGDYAGKLDLLKKKSATVFGSELGRVQTWAAANAHAMGLTKGEATGLAAGMSDLLIPMGFTRKAAADMSTQTVGLSGALAEWSGGTKSASEVTDILSAAFMGERDGLNALGISITQAEVDARLLANGQQNLTGKQKQQAEATATQALIMEKSVDAQNAYAKGAGSLARNTAESKARMKEMGETLATKAIPILLTVGKAVNEQVLPAIERFGGYLNENRFKIALFFIGIAEAVTGLVKFFGPAIQTMDRIYMGFVASMVHGAAEAFGWLPGIGPKLKDAAVKFDSFKAGREKTMNAMIKKSGEWNESLKKLKTETKLKADISDWETKLKAAKAQLADKNLTKERRAQLTATIKDLESKLGKAHTALDAGWITKQRIAKLTADKKPLDDRLAAAKRALENPKLTATKKATLTAEIGKLQRAVNAAQTKIDTLKGKTVSIEIKYTSGGVNLTTPSSVGRKALGGPIHGPGGPTDDRAGLYALSDDEHVVTAKEVHGAGGHQAVEAMRMRWAKGLATGGRAGGATFQSTYDAAAKRGAQRYASSFGSYGGAMRFASSQAGKNYGWGSSGPGTYDCSGFMSAITNYIRGKYPYSRVGSTGSFPWSGFARGAGAFMIGSRRGNPGHMAGTLMGMNVESRGGEGVVVGPRARGANNSLFGGNVWHLARLAAGGRAGDAPFDLLNSRGMHFDRSLRQVLGYAGGTSFVPRDGLAYLHRGERVTPAAQNRGLGSPLVIEIRSGGSQMDDLLVQILRKAVQTRGGDVQVVLGKRVR
jgi:cell wall-associated NlpC family hydrolase